MFCSAFARLLPPQFAAGAGRVERPILVNAAPDDGLETGRADAARTSGELGVAGAGRVLLRGIGFAAEPPEGGGGLGRVGFLSERFADTRHISGLILSE